jgi:hypothetical protein
MCDFSLVEHPFYEKVAGGVKIFLQIFKEFSSFEICPKRVLHTLSLSKFTLAGITPMPVVAGIGDPGRRTWSTAK